MQGKSVYEFGSYKEFLLDFEKSRSIHEKGFRTRLAAEIRCQPAFISQMFRGPAQFNLDQALRACKFLNLNMEETRFFLLLVEYDRASTIELKNFLKSQIGEIKEKYFDPNQQPISETNLDHETQSTYYSHWHYSAVHVLTTIPQFRTAKSIASALKISSKELERILVFLTAKGLLKSDSGKFIYNSGPISLPKSSPNFSRCQISWRLAAIDHLSKQNKLNFHYSTVSSLSKKDAEQIKMLLYKTIEKYVKIIEPSQEETLCAFNLDFFQIV